MIRIGVCSWTEKSLVASGEFYPREARTAEARLQYYASRFNAVEVDSTYYAIPDQRTAWLWDMRTPEGFTFHIKAYGALTGHPIDPKTLPGHMREGVQDTHTQGRHVYVKDRAVLAAIAEAFHDSLMPLRRTGKLGLLVYQFPPWFDYRQANLDYILFCRDLTAGMPLAVEFRHGSWLTSRVAPTVFGFLKSHDITYVAADEPQVGTLATAPFLPGVTAETAYFRFHGRNRENWMKKNVETSLRYAYSYSDAELQDFIPAMKEADRQAKTTYAMFNNCHRAFATTNGLRLKELLGSPSSPKSW